MIDCICFVVSDFIMQILHYIFVLLIGHVVSLFPFIFFLIIGMIFMYFSYSVFATDELQ